MSGPFCETCEFFYRPPLSGDTGECQDSGKIIYAYGGRPLNTTPEVSLKCECYAWTPKKSSQAERLASNGPATKREVLTMPNRQDAQAETGPLEDVVAPEFPPTLCGGTRRPVNWCYQLDRVDGSDKQTNSVTIFLRPHEPIFDESGESGCDEKFVTVTLTRAEVRRILEVLDEDIAEMKRAIPESAHEFE